MKHLSRILALIGLILAIFLFLRDDPSAVLALLQDAGASLALIGLVHVISIGLNAQAWRVILPGAGRPALLSMMHVVWIREAINGLLPVARIGGEIASYRLLRHLGIRRSPAIASLTVDVALSIVSQLIFALFGLLFLYYINADLLAAQIALSLALLMVIAVFFIALQHFGLFERIMRVLNQLAAGRFGGAISHSALIDRSIQAMYRRRRVIVHCVLWQLAGWITGAGEIWLALWCLGEPIGVIEAVTIEAVIQAVGSAAFLVPGALGVQEAAFLLIGAALGLGPTVALALAAARRIRDCVVFIPGLVCWQLAESRIAHSTN